MLCSQRASPSTSAADWPAAPNQWRRACSQARTSGVAQGLRRRRRRRRPLACRSPPPTCSSCSSGAGAVGLVAAPVIGAYQEGVKGAAKGAAAGAAARGSTGALLRVAAREGPSHRSLPRTPPDAALPRHCGRGAAAGNRRGGGRRAGAAAPPPLWVQAAVAPAHVVKCSRLLPPCPRMRAAGAGSGQHAGSHQGEREGQGVG